MADSSNMRPDLRLIAGNIREALADYDREALLEILTYVFKEYVVEGPPPLLVNQAERVADLEGLSFGQLITALQTRLDLVELSLFSVDGEQVSVRVGGVKTPLTGDAGALAAAHEPPAAPSAQPEPALRRGVNIVETELSRMPPRAAPEEPRASVDEAVARGRGAHAGLDQRRGVAPRPTGLSVRGGPARGGMMAPEPAEPAPPAQPEPASAPASETSGGDGDDASVRFSLLELD
ncbi:MAG TPA: hypothetical protein VML75_10355 [Kofleriaceae bacterium]|nr:hypothetical protein [Kofleriaceae bacterium]